jgi:hypothetical protein
MKKNKKHASLATFNSVNVKQCKFVFEKVGFYNFFGFRQNKWPISKKKKKKKNQKKKKIKTCTRN